MIPEQSHASKFEEWKTEWPAAPASFQRVLKMSNDTLLIWTAIFTKESLSITTRLSQTAHGSGTGKVPSFPSSYVIYFTDVKNTTKLQASCTGGTALRS